MLTKRPIISLNVSFVLRKISQNNYTADYVTGKTGNPSMNNQVNDDGQLPSNKNEIVFYYGL